MNKVIIIPARMQSQRLYGKPLLKICGYPLLWWTLMAARKARPDILRVATSDAEIIAYCEENDISYVCTPEAPTGTHRCALAYATLPDAHPSDIVVNWQVDEPAVRPTDVARLLNTARCDTGAVYTLLGPCKDSQSPDDVRAVVLNNRCHWFSRWPMPGGFYHHAGVYAYRGGTLIDLSRMPVSLIAQDWGLEQLTWIEAGLPIYPLFIDYTPRGVNSTKDVEAFHDSMVP